MKRRYTLRFSPRMVGQAGGGKNWSSRMIGDQHPQRRCGKRQGRHAWVVEFDGNGLPSERCVAWLESYGVTVSPMASDILFVQDKCVHCGSCTAVCQSGALSLDKDAHLVYAPSRCVVCGLCVHACPLRLFSVA
jgi:ferredoxin